MATDSMSSVKLSTLKRDGDYKAWACSMRAYLVTQKRLDKMLDAEPERDDAQAKENDIVCKAQLLLRVGGPLIAIVQRAPSAKAAWEALHK